MTQADTLGFSGQIARELSLAEKSVREALLLFQEGNTVPFIARYRKERTGSLDEVALRTISERAQALVELEARRATILASIREQGKLTPDLEATLQACTTRAQLEDLYLPYRPKRRTLATMAREAGLEPLAEWIWSQPAHGAIADVWAELSTACPTIEDLRSAERGALHILAERIAEQPGVRQTLRERLERSALLSSEAVDPDAPDAARFQTWFGFAERIATLPSHRYLAIRRGEKEGHLKVQLTDDDEVLRDLVRRSLPLRERSPAAEPLARAGDDALRRLLLPSLETELRVALKERADLEAVGVFADNLRHLLLAPPAGERAVLGIDPGLRTGCKCAMVTSTGTFVEHVTLYPSRGERAAQEAADVLVGLVKRHQPWAIAVGNGTAGRETEAFVRATLREAGLTEVVVLLANESGASIYSASDVAREEFPDLDLTIRGAISIARRVQDPLAELVKIDPKSIGVGQYQHDVQQTLLQRRLDEVVESCVNGVGVEVNTASAPLLSRVAGIGPTLARRIVEDRNQHGRFGSRRALQRVTGFGPRTFEQAAGFLRVRSGEHPLDASAVHPERYALVEEIARDLGMPVNALVGNERAIATVDIARYVRDDVGEPTLRDILDELRKPGRDPRAEFEPPRFREDVHRLEDLTEGMVLEGVVTNVTAFGAFVDIGVHQDGLVHISQLADRFVRDPAEVVQPGGRVKVKVLEVDLKRRRIALTCRLDAPAQHESATERPGSRGGRAPSPARTTKPARAKNDRQPERNTRRAQDEGAALRHNPFAALKR